MYRKKIILHSSFVKVQTSVIFTEEVPQFKEIIEWNKTPMYSCKSAES